MVHKKYIKRGGKTFGPYLYENYRENGVTKTRYLGLAKESRKLRVNKNFIVVAGVFFLIFSFLILFSFYNSGITGKVTSEIIPTYSIGEIIRGTFNLELKQEDLIPVDSVLKIKLGNQETEINLGSLLTFNSNFENETEEFASGVINLNLDDLNFSAESGNLEFSLIANGNELIKEIQEIKIEETTPETNKTENEIENITAEIVEEINETSEQNITEEEINPIEPVTEFVENNSELTESTIENNEIIPEPIIQENTTIVEIENIEIVSEIVTTQYKAVIGEPVRWIKTVNATEDLIIEIPKDAENISIKTGEEIQEALNEIETEKTERVFSMTGAVIGSGSNFLEDILGWFRKLSITGEVISEENIKIIENETSKIIEVGNLVELNEEVAVEYYTEAPKSEEEKTSTGKKIIVSTEEELGYKDILAYTNLTKEVSADKIQMYHLVNGSREKIQTENYDLNGNGLIDYVEWNVPHLSEQTYELIIIEISNAEHLDVNREFISDIYDSVKAKDNIWSEVIGDGEYVRIKFKKQLTNNNDITIYARGNAVIEVYEENSDELIATFSSVTSENSYKVYLTNLQDSQDTFDLKISGTAEFDYIVDPTFICSSCEVCSEILRNATESGTIVQLGNNLTGITDSCINFTGSDNVIFDCAGYTISGVYSGEGIFGENANGGADNITIMNCNVKSFFGIVYFYGTNNLTITNSTFSNGTNNPYTDGIRFDNSDDISISNSSITTTSVGLYSYYTNHIRLTNVNLSNNYLAVQVTGSLLTPICNNTFVNVTVGKSKSLGYYSDASGLTIQNNDSFGELLLCNISNSLINNISMSNQDGISSAILYNNIFTNLYIANTSYIAFFVHDGSNNTLTNSTFVDNSRDSVDFGFSDSNKLQNLIINQTGRRGINVEYTSYNNILNNITLIKNNYAVFLGYAANNVTINNSIFQKNTYGLYFLNSTLNKIINSTFQNNTYGLYFTGASNNNTFYNNFFNNTLNYYNASVVTNFFNTTQSLSKNIIGSLGFGGNYWTNYTGGFSTTCADANHDGICDTTYSLDGVNYDYLPLAKDITPPNINFTNPTPLENQTLSRVTGANAYINVSTSELNNYSAWIDWNRTLSAWYNFDSRNATHVFDNSSYQKLGNITGAVYTPGIRGGALSFDGDDDYILIDSDSNLSNVCIDGCTFSTWIYVADTFKQGYPIARYDSTSENKFFYLYLSSTGVLQLYINPDGGNESEYCMNPVTTVDYPLNQWFLATGVYNLTSVSTYIDGVLYSENSSCPFSSINQTAWQDSEPILFGVYDDGTLAGDFNGSLDEVMIFSRALSPEEINATYNAKTYPLYHNFTNLVDTTYTYQAYTIDQFGNGNKTELRNVSVYTTAPIVNFVVPTPGNNFQGVSEFFINVSVTTNYLNNITYNWNGTNYYFDTSGSNLTSILGAGIVFNISNSSSSEWYILINQSGLSNSTFYTYSVKATDLYGNYNVTETRQVRGPNSAPSATTPILSPTILDRTKNLTCNFTVTDLDSAIIWSDQVRPSTETLSAKMDCDPDYCYSIDASGYFIKVNKTSGQQIFNRTNGNSRRVTSVGTRGFSCDIDFCYASDWDGSDSWFLKINKSSGYAIYNKTTYTGVLSTNMIYSMYCNNTGDISDFCYGGDSQGYIVKVNKTSGEHIWNLTAGSTVQLSSNYIYGLSCNSDACYAADSGGYFFKFNKTDGATNYSSQISPTAIYSFYCDDDYCYGGDGNGYLLKAYKNSTQVWNTITGSIVRPTTSAIYAVSCDSDYCYGIDSSGYVLKVNNTNTASLVQQFWNVTTKYIVRPTTNTVYGITCDSTYCYGGNNGYVVKFRKFGDPVYANMTWYKNEAVNLSYIFPIVNGTTINNTLVSGNFTKGDEWICGVTPYDSFVYGISVNSSTMTIQNAIPNITRLQINPPSYVNVSTSADIYYSDFDADSATLNFTWYINGVNMENDSLESVASGTFATVYLNASKNAGDVITISVIANDGTNDSLVNTWKRLIWNLTNLATTSTNGIYGGVYCDDDYCYAGDYAGYFIKVSKLNGTQIFNTSSGSSSRPTTSPVFSPTYCGTDFCYMGDYNGYFLKINKTSGKHIFNITSGYTNRLTTAQIDSIYCDDYYCYLGDGTGYYLQVSNVNGTQIFNKTTGYTNQPTTGLLYQLSCDADYCYGTDSQGYFLKINKTSGVHIYNTTVGNTNRPSTNAIYALYCNSEFCYAGDSLGYFLKINKTDGTHIYNTTLGYTQRPTTNTIIGISCNHHYCYVEDSGENFIKINKTSGLSISSIKISSASSLSFGLSCDADYCYMGDSLGYFKKVFQADNVTVENYPEISFDSGTTTASGNYSRDYISANATINNYVRIGTIKIAVYNSTSLATSSSTQDTSLTSYFVNFTSLPDGIYSLNATLNNTNGDTNITETRTILLDTTGPVINITFPKNTSASYSATISFNATLSDALQTVSSCQYSLDGVANVTMDLNASKTFANTTYSGITHGYHNLTISCNDSLNNWGSATEFNFQISLLDLSIANVTFPSTIYSNSTFITINISNQGPPAATNVNVSCYFNDEIFESKVIDSISGAGSYITNCTKSFTPANNQNFTVSIDPSNSITENNETNNNYTFYFNTTQIANITINTVSFANTTDTISVEGQIIGNNGSSLINKRFTIKLNDVTVSSNTLNFSNFESGVVSEVNTSSNTLRLNLSSEGNLNNYADTYSTNSYKTDAHVVAYNSEGYYAPSGILFSLNDMTSNVGNITYKYNSTTKFYNATAYIESYSSASPAGGNLSLWYSFDNSTWYILSSTDLTSTTVGGAIPNIDGKTIIYLRINSDTYSGTKENPLTRFEFNYTNYNYSASGSLISSSINLPNITYTVLKWDEDLNDGEIKLQLRESDDNSTWGAWSSNYTSHLENDISSFTKQYLQYRVWLSTTNQSLTPILYSVNLSYFNASTNSTGGYKYNITLPTTNIGVLPLEVSISQTPSESDIGISGANTTDITIWARTVLSYSVEKNYSTESNYSVHVNFTRSDTNGFVNGTVNVTIYNATTILSHTCYDSTCTASWLIPSELSYGNYTINITGYNETAYYQNATIINFEDYLEEKNTTGVLILHNKTISDYNPSADYYFYLNATINNTGRARMNNPHVWSSSLEGGAGFANVSEITPCEDILPNQSCSALILVTVKSGLGQREDAVTWRANWTDNDGSVSGGAGYISYTSYITIESNAIMNISNSSISKTIQHEASDSFVFDVESTGTDDLVNINISFIDGDLASWITIDPNWIAGLVGGQTSTINVSISVPAQTTPGNYSGLINVSSTNAGEKYLTLNITVPQNLSWYFVPTTNYTYNRSFALNTAGEIANYTIVNIGNVNLSMNISYSPGGTTCIGSPYDYSCQGTTIFSSDYGDYNPTHLNVTKGENTTFTVYQKGFTSTLNDVRVIVGFYNESANPVSDSVQDTFYIYQRPPNVTNVWFYLDGIAGNKSEVNKNLTIKVRATDDVNINESATKINVTYGSTTITLNATSLCSSFGECVGSSGSRTVANFTANFTPTTTGLHSVKVIVFNTEATPQTYNSTTYNFTSYGTTTLNLSQNQSSISIGSIDKTNKYIFYLNYSINNTGVIYAYNPNLSFSSNNSILTGPASYTFSNLSSGTNTSKVFQINVSALTPPGVYNLTATINWTNPDRTNSSASTVFNITILSNKSIDYSPSSLSYTLSSGTQNSSILTINNSGNDLLTAMNIECYTATLCPSFTLAYNESDFSIEKNNSKNINISLTASSGLAAGVYTGGLNITEQNISKTISISATVPESLTWTVSLSSLNITRGVSSVGDLQVVTINNTGNVNITFEISSSNSSLIGTNVSTLVIPLGNSSNFMINYSAPPAEGSYVVVINITNSSASPVLNNITINLTATQTNVTVLSPTTTSPLGNVTFGMNISVTANVSYVGVPVTSGINWTVTIGGSSCTNLSSEYVSNIWNMSCLAPNITDGITYDLIATMTHATYGTIAKTETNAIIYKDITPPSFNITQNNINLNQSINLQVNVTDNAAVDTVSAILIYPNSSTFNLSLSLSGGFYINNSINLTLPGEYIVTYIANDTTNNVNSSSDWFEVYDNYLWNVNLLDYNSQAVPNVNLTLYRPNTTTILANGTTNSTGMVRINVSKRFYDINVFLNKENLTIQNVNFTNLTESNVSLNLYKITDVDLSEIIPLYKPLVGIASNSTGFDTNGLKITFDNYSQYSYDSVSALSIIKCAVWNYTERTCDGSWTAISFATNIDTKKVSGNSTGFSSYFLAESKCGNGLCEVSYGETTSTCSNDCLTTSVSVTTSGGGGGGGGGGATVSDIEDLLKNYFNVGGVKVETTSIYKEMFAGESATVRITLSNSLSTPSSVQLSAEGDIKNFIFFESSAIELGARESQDLVIKIVLPRDVYPGNYDGNLIVGSGGYEGKIPMTVRILVPEGKLLDIKILPLKATVAPGKIVRLQTDLLNLGQTKRVDVQFDLQLIDVNTGNVITRAEEAFAVETTFSTIKNLTIPEQTPVGKYIVKATAYYSNLEQQYMQASSIAYIFVDYPLLQRRFLGIPVWVFLLIALLIGSIDGFVLTSNWLKNRKKRFKGAVEFNKLPTLSSSSIFVGKVAETSIRTFLDLNKLQMHTLIAGATGSGKTIAAQDIVEGALMHKKSVIIFDPTAQWTGFFRPSDDKTMLKRYQYFDMKVKDAKGFNGTIKTIHDPYEIINLSEYMAREGEITIFDISNLTPADIDIIVASTTEQIFKSKPEESKELKSLIVYDEVHRLLPKFGGSGRGFVQLERGAREFRKWGIGLLLISQVLSDFVGEIKANIGTEIQMGTRYEGDLERISLKYGEDILKSVVKEPIGTGMLVNAEYNSGKPYFVSFRPLLHSTKRLSTAELKKYEAYFDQIEDLDYQMKRLEQYGIDILDLKLELKITKDKIKAGQFQMVDMYLESLLPVIAGHWKSLGKNPEHIVLERLTKSEVTEGIEKAAREREKYLKEHPEKKLSLAEELSKLRKGIEEKRKSGKNTTDLESKLNDFQNRLKTFTGKVSVKDAQGIMLELNSLKKILGSL